MLQSNLSADSGASSNGSPFPESDAPSYQARPQFSTVHFCGLWTIASPQRQSSWLTAFQQHAGRRRQCAGGRCQLFFWQIPDRRKRSVSNHKSFLCVCEPQARRSWSYPWEVGRSRSSVTSPLVDDIYWLLSCEVVGDVIVLNAFFLHFHHMF